MGVGSKDLFEQPGKRGRPPQYSRWRGMVNACCYVVRNGCSWRMLPHEFPPWENVYRTFRRWAAGGKFEQMHDRLRELWRSREERAPEPTAAVLDAQSTRSSPQGGPSGYDRRQEGQGSQAQLGSRHPGATPDGERGAGQRARTATGPITWSAKRSTSIRAWTSCMSIVGTPAPAPCTSSRSTRLTPGGGSASGQSQRGTLGTSRPR